MQRKEFETICAILGYNFKNERLLENALTHSSFVNEKAGAVSNERLEFLGDTVLGFIVSEELYLNTFLSEGKMTEIRKPYVCADTLSDVMERSGLLQYLKTGKGALPLSKKTKSNVFEALLAAIYLDSGHNKEAVSIFLMPLISKEIEIASKDQMAYDYKTSLQQFVQASGSERLQYALIAESGPDHAKEFTVEVRLNSNVIGVGSGRTKREAEQCAAKEALLLFDVK
jgi:ribonuclease-3